MIYQRSVTVAVAWAAIVGVAHASPLTNADTSTAYAACIDKSGGHYIRDGGLHQWGV
jgi:hypothetical protein